MAETLTVNQIITIIVAVSLIVCGTYYFITTTNSQTKIKLEEIQALKEEKLITLAEKLSIETAREIKQITKIIMDKTPQESSTIESDDV